MSNKKIEEQLEQLSALPNELTPETAAVVRKALKARINVIVAKAAKVTAARDWHDLIPELIEAFDRMFDKPAERDPQCWAKTALAAALRDLDYHESPPYRKGAVHIQMEPVWGGQEDTAITLRATCILALVPCPDISREDLLRLLVDALTESSLGAAPIRQEAVRALEQLDGCEPALLLRLKARLGDEDPRVTGQVFESLLRLESEHSISLVSRFMDSKNEEVADEAALALGTARLPAAVAVLVDQWKRRPGNPILLRALSISRQQTALDFLLSLVRQGRAREASAALDALRLHGADSQIYRDADEAFRLRSQPPSQ